ncbi:helix-turn-helix domain-containing protein [Acidaminobacter hydrogenoformans]|uniref:Uncharacterized protein n=1 Tax=Acidaminobacter hydrogenoformans DSM 2784 TaxID=1120920 RepID=A0A1G5S241_9FIRM|nr:helix-turn-helix transcriptional regulator [Acidaminobacter hydrogenoformans]SCZ80465.1 hypothetical protein SAMN03080599_02284 [Acidaminobacter hydrogenoformans DSM 2784]
MHGTESKLSNVVSNIYTLINRSNKKIGELESFAGVSTGYLSRQNKEGGVVKLSLEFVIKAAEFLEVNLDDLVGADLSTLTPDEQFLMRFFEKVIEDTISCELDWKRESENSLDDYNKPHILFEYRRSHNEFGEIDLDAKVYISQFVDNAFINGDAYRTLLKDTNSELIIMNCSAPSKSTDKEFDYFYELYIIDEKEAKALCCTFMTNEPITKQIERLYLYASENSKNIKMDKGIKAILGLYMDGVPF